jgi:riboflavin synthase
MFTGIVTDIGILRDVTAGSAAADTRFVIGTDFDPDDIGLGASIACSGACLTVIEKGRDGEGAWFAVEASQETLDHTTLGDWQTGRRINLERALKAGDELGGHIVSGHVDAVGTVTGRHEEGGSVRFTIAVPAAIAPFVAPKGSIAIDGVSLTVNEVTDEADGTSFGINVIPHTQSETTFGTLAEGAPVNLEVDMLARYVARLADSRRETDA